MILCGLFCAGKSTIGAGLAAYAGLPFYDTDRMMEADQGKPVGVIWQDLGEEAFRDLETEIVLSLKKGPCVIATGGGTLLRTQNRVHLHSLGKTVYLKAPVPVLWERLQKRGLPAYLDRTDPLAHLEKLAEERFPIYTTFCDYIIDTQKLTIECCTRALLKYFSS